MYFPIIQRLLHCPRHSIIPIQYAIQTKHYAGPVRKSKKVSVVTEKKLLPVETEVNRLLTFVCGTNICKDGEDIKIKPDSEYPSWLWTIRIGPPLALEELDPNTKQYWRKLRKLRLLQNNKLQATKKF